MNFEYNGNLLEEDRINLVSSEIINKYSDISYEKAKEAAMLEGSISDNVTTNDKLNRLYNIMFVNMDNKSIVYNVFVDYLQLLITSKPKDSVFLDIVDDINQYLNNYGEFPFLSDYQ